MFSARYHNWQIAETMTSASIAEQTARKTQTHVDSLERRLKRLEEQVERLRLARMALGTMALAELRRDRLGVPQADLDAKVEEIDLRDGKLDRKLSSPLPICPGCRRTNSPQRTFCLYCGKRLPVSPLF